MIRTVLFGACGRMGSYVAEELVSQEDIQLSAGIEKPGSEKINSIINGIKIKSEEDVVPEADVWIDFSLAVPALNHAEIAANSGTPILIGSTGFSSEQLDRIMKISKRTAVLLLPNCSVGIGVMNVLASKAATKLNDKFDASITELHHSGKVDAPSGTAKLLAMNLNGLNDNPQVLSIRSGSAIGEHELRFVGEHEEIVITHRAYSRKAFSSGVPLAVRFLNGKEPGFYDINDLYT